MNIPTIAAFLLGLLPTPSSALLKLVGSGENLFNNEQLEKENLPNRLYADVSQTNDSSLASGMIGSGGQDADDDSIFHFAAKCMAVSDDQSAVYVGGELVAMPGKPKSKHRHLLQCHQELPDAADNADQGFSQAQSGPACFVLFFTTCLRCLNAGDNPAGQGAGKCEGGRKLLSEEGCTDEELCQHGSQGIYKIVLGETQEAGFMVPVNSPFEWDCEGFKDLVEPLEFNMDPLTSGSFALEEVEEEVRD